MTAVSRLTTDDVLHVYGLINKDKFAEAQALLDICAEGCRKGFYDTSQEMPDALANLAAVMAKRAKTEQSAHELATLFFESALKIEPTHARALESLAIIYIESATLTKLKYDQRATPNESILKAKELFERLLAGQPKNVSALSHLANLMHFGIGGVQKDEKVADQYCRRILAIDPTNEFANIIKMDALSLSDH